MRRREFITITGGAVLTWPLAAWAEAPPPKRPVIAWLTTFTAPKPPPTFVKDFLQGLEERGYIQGQNFDFVFRSADGHPDRVPAIVEEFERLRTDVILAGATLEAVVAKKATSDDPNCLPGTRRRHSSWLDRKRVAAGRQSHGDRTLCCGPARQTNRTRARNNASREQNWAAH